MKLYEVIIVYTLVIVTIYIKIHIHIYLQIFSSERHSSFSIYLGMLVRVDFVR